MQLSQNALTTLEARYLLRNDKGEVVETPEELFDRIASSIASVENNRTLKNLWRDKFHRLLASLDFLPNTPTIMNAGLERGQLSACYVLPIDDSIRGIYTTLADSAVIHQSGGGTGFSFGRLRPADAVVDSKQGVASGPISFASVYNQSTEIMKQGGKRKGANMMIMPIDHPDILAFIDMKLTPGVMTNFNVSVAITDAFMDALANDSTYQLKHPKTGVTDVLKARYVWNKIAENAHRSAEPGLIFIDRINKKSAYWEEIEATNPCGEQPLPPYGSCNLGSINLSNFVTKYTQVAWVRLAEVVYDAVRFLDNVIDANVYPTQELHDHAHRYRNIGLGVMGWADMLIKLGIPYNSDKAVQLGKTLMRFINAEAHRYSIRLAQEKGTPSGAPFKSFFAYSRRFRRNATLTTVAPTGSLCILANCSSGVEPNFAYELEKHVLDTVLVEYHPLYKEAKETGTFNKEVFVEAHEVSGVQHVDMQAAFQENCDSAISKTINLPNDASVSDVQSAYTRAWETGCKGITVYRDGSRMGVLHRVEKSSNEETCCEAPNIRVESGCETCQNCHTSKCLIA